MNMLPIEPALIELFILTFIRVVTALTLLPVFRDLSIPSMVKVGLAGLIALVIVPTLQPAFVPASGTILDFLILAGNETACGLVIGFCGYLFFYAVDVAGQLVGYQAGFTMVASFDPSSDAQNTIMTQFFHTFAILLFLSFNGHHLVIQAVHQSFSAIPIGHFSLDARFLPFATQTVSMLVSSGILMAAPILITLLVTDVGLGVLSRVAPAMNIFALGFALKVATALLTTAATLGLIASLFTDQALRWMAAFPKLFELLRAP
jgi:flagellar biosynthetic protein FliR